MGLVSSTLCIAAASFGVLAHLGIFINGEWHLRGPNVVKAHVVALVLGPYLWASSTSLPFLSCVIGVLSLFTLYLITLFVSIAVYRLLFHRLRHFPGPRLAGLTKLWHAYQCRDSRNYLVLDDLHRKYGPFVRTGEFPRVYPQSLSPMSMGRQRSAVDTADMNKVPRRSPSFIHVYSRSWTALRTRTSEQNGTI